METKEENSEEGTIYDLNATCRLCSNVAEKFVNFYTAEGLSCELVNKINMYLPVKVSIDDDLPLQTCLSCTSSILAWHEFVYSSIEWDQKLKTLNFSKSTKSGEENSDSERISDAVPMPSDPSLIDFCQSGPSSSDSLDNDTACNSSLDMKSEFTCSQCSQSYRTENELKKHETTAHCKKKSVSKHRKVGKRKQTKLDMVKANAAKVVVDGQVYYNCKECGKSLHSPYTFVWHTRIHTGERPFICDLCGKQFRVSQGLIRHVKETHEGIKKFACDLCGRMFATRRNVEEHRRIHTNERPYICDLCGKTFKQKASLFVHNRSHTNHFPFKCTFCSQGFKSNGAMITHITKHTGEKPYKCDVCGRCFRIKYELKRHKLIHSEEKPFACGTCGMTFRQKRYMMNHFKANHNPLMMIANN